MDVESLINSKHFCALPFVRQTYFFDGEYRLCCHTGQQAIPQGDNDKVFNSESMKSIRESFLKGEFPTSCQGCKKLVDSNLTSPSKVETQSWVTNRKRKSQLIEAVLDAQQGHDILPSQLDLRYSNVCNLKCRTCNPFNSSAIQAEYNKIDIIDPKFVKREIKHRHQHAFPKLNETFFGVYIAGGEPLLEDCVLDFLTSFEDKSIDVVINTNLTVLSESVLDLLTSYNKISLTISIDGYGQLNNYIRNGSDFDTIITNIDRYIEKTQGQGHFSITSVLNMYNVFDLYKLAEFIQGKYQNVEHRICSVVDTPELTLDCLPLELRTEAVESLEKLADIVSDNSTVNDAIGLIESKFYKLTEFLNFIRYAKILDNVRNENLSEIVPQYKSYY